LSLRLAGHDQTRAVGPGRLQHLAREKHHCGFNNGEQHGEERRGDQSELDRGRAILLTHQRGEPTLQGSVASRLHQAGHDRPPDLALSPAAQALFSKAGLSNCCG
jgi:hypothetical protein